MQSQRLVRPPRLANRIDKKLERARMIGLEQHIIAMDLEAQGIHFFLSLFLDFFFCSPEEGKTFFLRSWATLANQTFFFPSLVVMSGAIQWLASMAWNEWLVPSRKEHSPVNKLLFQPPSPMVASQGDGREIFQLLWGEDEEDSGARERSSSWSIAPSLSREATYVYLAPQTNHIVGARHRLVVFFHGNACNVEQSLPLLRHMQDQLMRYNNYSKTTHYHILAVEYDGYSTSTAGQPIVADVLAAKIHRVVEHVCAQNPTLGLANGIIFFGQSIGTAVASQTVARHYNSPEFVAANPQRPTLILLSPFTSVRDLANDLVGGFGGAFVHERFGTLDALRTHLRGWRLAIMHGKLDALIPCAHSQRIYDACSTQNVCTLDWLEGDHCDLDWQHIIHNVACC